MKLLTHNMLACHVKGCAGGYPLKIEATKVEVVDTDFDADFLRHVFPRLEWGALVDAAAAVGAPPLPRIVSDDMLASDTAFLRAFHHALLEVTLLEGALVCPATGRRFPVESGIPNMLLTEDECA